MLTWLQRDFLHSPGPSPHPYPYPSSPTLPDLTENHLYSLWIQSLYCTYSGLFVWALPIWIIIKSKNISLSKIEWVCPANLTKCRYSRRWIQEGSMLIMDLNEKERVGACEKGSVGLESQFIMYYPCKEHDPRVWVPGFKSCLTSLITRTFHMLLDLSEPQFYNI